MIFKVKGVISVRWVFSSSILKPCRLYFQYCPDVTHPYSTIDLTTSHFQPPWHPEFILGSKPWQTDLPGLVECLTSSSEGHAGLFRLSKTTARPTRITFLPFHASQLQENKAQRFSQAWIMSRANSYHRISLTDLKLQLQYIKLQKVKPGSSTANSSSRIQLKALIPSSDKSTTFLPKIFKIKFTHFIKNSIYPLYRQSFASSV